MASDALRAIDLRVDFSHYPLGIDESKPIFSWIPVGRMRGHSQRAYRIIVSSSYENSVRGMGDVWDTGVVESESNVIEYNGPPLKSFTKYFWRVKLWDNYNVEGSWSDVAWFETAVLNESEWEGIWIGGGQLLRKEFKLEDDVAEARLYVAGLGYFELRINGTKVGENALEPLWSDYSKRIYYSVYDVTDIVKKGGNVIAVMLGRGRYSPKPREGIMKFKYYGEPCLLLMLRIRLANGKNMVVRSDESWKCLEKGPILSDDIYDGFKYDENLEPVGWDQYGFDETGWRQCHKASNPGGRLVSSTGIPATRVMGAIKPKEVYNPSPGVYVFDFGQNVTGWVRLRIRRVGGKKEIKVRYAEVIENDGSLNVQNIRGAESTDIFVLREVGTEFLEPKFTYHGFRYAEVSGLGYPPAIDDIEAIVVHANLEIIGSFSCSNKLINDIHRLVIWSLKGNLTNGVQTDCPQRDERMGWLGDAWISSEAAVLNFNMIKYYEKIINDIIDAQKEDGSIPDVVPPYWDLYPADPAWGTAFIYIPWVLYLYYGFKRPFERGYAHMKKWWNFLYSRAKGNILYFGKYGDWVPPGRVKSIENCPMEIIGTWILYRDAKILMRVATILGLKEDVEYFGKKAEELREAFNKAFLHEDVKEIFKHAGYYSIYIAPDNSKVYLGGTQTANSLALIEDIVPPDSIYKILESLVNDIKFWDKHFNVGILGAKYVPKVLTKYGYTQLAYEVITNESYPSYGYMIKEGATTLWERWELLRGPGMNSHNHHMFGSIDAWFFESLAGIELIEPAFKLFNVNIPLIDGLNHASAWLYTIKGLLAVSWSKKWNSLKVDVIVPTGSKARIYLPRLADQVEVLENGLVLVRGRETLRTVEGVMSIREEKDKLVIEVTSGKYSFEIRTI